MKGELRVQITSPAELRAVVFETMIGVLEGRVSVPQANSVAALSAEAHKSIRQQWDMQCYTDENIFIENGSVKAITHVE
jgi:hypothetical protein